MTEPTSRQDLVVAPPTSRLPVAVTAGGSACLGFALVWGMLASGRLFSNRAVEREPAPLAIASDPMARAKRPSPSPTAIGAHGSRKRRSPDRS